jgi:phosphate transport system substrate-binding protein
MSRKMKAKEEAEFVAQFAYKPTFIPVAIDALSVYVHKDNPIQGLSLPEVDAIFSSSHKCNNKDAINRWSDVGVKKLWATKAIQIFGRNSVSGTYSYFKKKALCKGNYKTSLQEKPGSAAVVEAVANTLNGVGYSGIGYKTDGVRIVPLSKKAGEDYVPATTEAIETGKYPLARYLYLYVNKKPGQPLPTLEAEFIKFVLSRQGQQIVIKDGYIPLPNTIVNQSLAKLK